MSSLDFAEIRRLVIIAMFSDDVLYEHLVLKGGNAISLVYEIGKRSSLDVDFSIEGEFADLEDIQQRIQHALNDRFGHAGFIVFDFKFGLRPSTGGEQHPGWGGYGVDFKLIEKPHYDRLTGLVDGLRRNALVIGPDQQRIFSIDISKNEYCAGKTERELERFTIFVYSPAMIAVEKLRAICQQMPEYPLRVRKYPRARDFYDIWLLIEHAKIDFGSGEIAELVRSIFSAKEVGLELISKISKYREFHQGDWQSVQDSVMGPTESFDFYFDRVVREALRIKILLDEKDAK